MTDLTANAPDKLHAGDSPYGVAAVYVGECGAPGLDGVQWKCHVTDGSQSQDVDLTLSGTRGGGRGMQVEPAVIEKALEYRSGSFPRESRLADLAAASPVALSADDLDRFKPQAVEPGNTGTGLGTSPRPCFA